MTTLHMPGGRSHGGQGRQLILTLVVGLSVVALSGCSAGMALWGVRYRDPTILYLDHPRAKVIEELGEPDASTVTEDGRRADTYVIIRGNESSKGRAAFHVVMDIITFSFWELIATPMEMGAGKSETSTYTVTYDQNSRVVDVQVREGAVDLSPAN